MNGKTVAWIFIFAAALAVLTKENLAQAGDFTLKGEGRDTDLMSIERSVNPAQNLKIKITGNHPYHSESKGKFSLYKDKRQKIKEILFALQPGETKSWKFPAEEEINLVNLGVYGKGEIKMMLQQGAQIPVTVEAGTKPVISEKVPVGSDTANQSSEAVSGSFPLLLKEAEKSYRGGNKLEAVEKLKQAVLAIWDEVPLTIKNVRLVEDNQAYLTRQSNAYGLGEKIHLTGQMFGYKLKKTGESYLINITTDVLFLQDGQVVTGKQDFGKFEVISSIPNTEFRLDLTYWLTNAPKGVYDIQTTIHDQNSSQSTKFTVPVEIN